MKRHISTEPTIIETRNPALSIDTRLSELYGEAVGTGAAEAVPVVRTTLANLLVYCNSSEEADRAASDAAAVVGMYPCRAVIVSRDVPPQENPRASVSLVCGITERADRRLCGEVIRLHVSRNCELVTGSVLPVLVPDVPVFLWLRGQSDEDIDSVGLSALIDHVIIDSCEFARPTDPLGIMSTWRSSLGIVTHDLCWVALKPWREFTARHFDAPQSQRYLEAISQVELHYNARNRSGMPNAASVLTGAWVAASLGLEMMAVRSLPEGKYAVRCKSDRLAVDIVFSPDNENHSLEGISAINVRCDSDDAGALFSTRMVSAEEIAVSQDCADLCLPEQTASVRTHTRQEMVSSVLDWAREDLAYTKTVSLLVKHRDILVSVMRGDRGANR